MQRLGEGLRQAVGKRLDHDLGVVVVGALEAPRNVLLANAGGDGKAADIVGDARVSSAR